jgi:integrase
LIARYRPKVLALEPKPRPKAKANRKRFTEQNVLALRVKPHQHFVWDEGTGAVRGLSILVNPTGTKTYFVNYRFPGSEKLHYKKLGRVGEITLEAARTGALEARQLANQNKDPKADDPAKSDKFETVFRDYIEQEQLGRKKNTSALATQSMMLRGCAAWTAVPIATITYREIDRLLAKIRDGNPDGDIEPRPYAAARIYSHLRDFFNWCARQQLIKDNPMAHMPKPFTVMARDRHYTDDELRAIWKAADQLDLIEGSYVKLIVLLVTRKDELALAQWSEFDNADKPTVFTVPTERVKMKAETKRKKKPVYVVPLPALAQRILKAIPRHDAAVFPKLDAGSALKAKLVKLGAPADFKLHTARHTVATFFQNKGRSEMERGLLLNHSGSGSVTAGYSHGYPIELKRDLITEWAEHIEKLVEPAAGVTRLR